MKEWHSDAKDLYFKQKQSLTKTRDVLLARYFPDKRLDVRFAEQFKERIWGFLRHTDEYKALKAAQKSPGLTPEEIDDQQLQAKIEAERRKSDGVEEKSDGTRESDRLITICENEEMTPDFLMKAHNLDPERWEVVTYRNNYWHSQKKGGKLLVMYQSKLTVKPRETVTMEHIEEFFAELDRSYAPPRIKPRIQDGVYMAEVNIADLHYGKLCWHGDTGNDFDHKIAKKMFYDIIARIKAELEGRPLEYITFVWSNDFFNSDTPEKTTTAGTQQDTDLRWQKLFDNGVQMLIDAMTELSQINGGTIVKTFYTRSNHDEQNSYFALKVLWAWFRLDCLVEIDTSPLARKYQLYGNTLIGYTHGDKEKDQKGGKEKVSRLAGLMPIEAHELWGKAKFKEMHTAHLHSEHATEGLNGVIVRRISSPTATDVWHYQSGYVGAVRKAQTFIYHKELGLLNTINTPVIE
jgi:hypothetical protein